ncbi:MAG: transporter substrate-binding protein, partial [Deltaproteobacteria bacterium]|nr:transporter substrate-binding protein [Deltaproteobacteria bacterium]
HCNFHEQPVKIGFIEDLSGDLSIYGISKWHAAQLAVKEINAGLRLVGSHLGAPGRGLLAQHASKPPLLQPKGCDLAFLDRGGETDNRKLLYAEEDKILVRSKDGKGLLGRKVELKTLDGRSDIESWKLAATRLMGQDKIDVLVAGFTSASREAIRPIVDENQQLYFYTNQYEGGVADKNAFFTGAVCEQQVIPVVDFMVRVYGPRIYIIAADYNFGRLTAAWTRTSAPLVGGEIIGEEFIPLGVSAFGEIVERIRTANPDWVMTLLIGAGQQNYYPQAAERGLRFPMASTVNMAQGYEHVKFRPPALANLHNAVNYMMEIPTIRNRAFVKRWFNLFPKDSYIGQEAQNTYFSIHLYANAVRLAGTTEQPEVILALESGLHIEAPEGTVFLDPATHHAAHYIRLARADKHHNITFVQEWPMINAWWLSRLGVNLVRHPEYRQYVPEDDLHFAGIQKR